MDSIEQSKKFAPQQRYFNISVLWIFYFRAVLRLLYRLRIPHEAVTLVAIGFGLASAYLFYHGYMIAAAVTLHFKDIFDACDGALARMTGRGHLIGRYLDSVGDFVALTAVLAAVTIHAAIPGREIYILWGILAWLSLFIQCSFFNYYQLAYAEQSGGKRLSSERDERSRSDLNEYNRGLAKKTILAILRFLYIIVYTWQDKLVAAVDGLMRRLNKSRSEEAWYGDKTMMTLVSPLCFGTHIFVIIVFAVIGWPRYALPFIATVMNIYILWTLLYRIQRGAKNAGVDGTTT
jgi:phosphatidylglycerophosphate synthase